MQLSDGLGLTYSPLSYGQQALWFLYQMAPESVAYNIFITVRITSELNIPAFYRTAQKIFERHPILRTTYTTDSGKPVQLIHEKQELPIQVIDVSSWSEDYLREQIFAETDRPFNLEKGPVLRVKLFTRSAQEHILLLTMHHIAGDMWSFDLLLNELQVLYTLETAEVSQEQAKIVECSLPETKPYTEFVRWQSEMLSSSKGEELWDYWQNQLAGELPILNLPTDRLRPNVQTYRGATHIFKLDEQLIQGLRELALTSGTSLYRILLAAFYVQLYRYTNQEDILVGSPMAGRWGGEFQGIVGYFVNPVVLRTSVSGNVTFKELLAQVSRKVKEAQEHQDYPFPLIVERLQLQRDASRSPLFQVGFTWQKQRWCEPQKNSSHLQEQGFGMEPYLLGHQRGAAFDLDVMVMEASGVLQVGWQYNSDLFDSTTIERMARHFQTLLEGIFANPEQRVSELPLLTESERHQLLVEWNNTFADYPQDKCIHQLFEAQVEQNPDAVAVVFEDQQLTYRELNYRANKLAHYLQALGVKPEVLVGICVERSLEMVMGILGILKAGGAYVPLDPVYPGERLAFMLEDSAVPVLLTQQKLVTSLPEHQARVVCLDGDWEEISAKGEIPPISDVTPENLAYVIYTSGSTGKPKGVLIAHRGLCNLAQAQIKLFDVQPDSHVLQLATFSFDASISEIVMALCSGARLCLGTPASLQPGQPLLRLLQEQGITHLTLVPSALAALPPQQLPALQTIIVAGEACPTFLIAQWAVGRRFFNAYGPTESTVCATVAQCFEGRDVLRIGRPIDNTLVYILDRNLQPVPISVAGELHIAGVGLARGYLNRPDLTDEKFIANPFSNEPGSRLYKTGDKARYLPGGNIEFLGRIDNQVKIRGFRIELGEIEALLSQHPGIRETVVTVRENATGDKQLVAYIVPHQEPAPTISDLRHFLKEQLPDYMVPSAFVTLESLPLTPNGKVDRRALPEPEFRPELELTFVAPRTPIEEMLANIWAGVLGIEQVGVHDNFFELGGHSLLATQVLTRVRDTLAVELPLHSLFEAPTVASLAQQVEITLYSGQSIQVPPLLPIPRSGNIPLSFAQARLWFLDQLQPNSAFYNIPIALRLCGQLNVAALESGLNEIIRRHEVLRTNFTKVSGQPIAVIASTRELKLLLVDLQNLPKSEREVEAERLATTEAERPFNLEREPLVRATLLQLDETEYVFLLTVHHIIFDGWSTGVFYGELAALYEAFCTGKPKVLPELPIQYADFAIWKRRWLTPEVLETQLNYWKQQLKDAPTLLELPTSRPRKAIQTFRGAHQSFTLSLELSKALAAYSKRTGVTLFMTLYAAFVTWLYRYTGSDDIVIGTPIANRNRREIEGLIGFFVNTLVLRTDLSGNPSFEQLLYRVREVAIGAYAHQDLPFEQLVEALQPERSLSYTPLFQVMFALDDASMPSIELFDLTVSSYSVETGTAKFDLTLSMENTASGLIGEWEYNTDLFDIDTIARMAGHFQILLEGIVANPIQPISQLPLLTERERHQLLVEWNNTWTEFPQDKCIHQLFEEQVERSPSSIAIVFEEEQLTYQALNARANQLAHYLRSLGVRAEVLVGIYVERSLEMVVGILGILKAGGAYVPLDPNYPTERLAYILSDSGVSVLLTQQRLVDRLPKQEAQVVCLDTQWEIIAQHGEENIACGVNAENLAYVIYTSGSTGKPKGVTIQHRSLVNYTTAVSIEYEIEKSDCILQFSSISFDVSAEEIYTTLTSGATLVLRTESMLDSVEIFLQKCRDWEITVLALPTAYWHELAVFLSQEKIALPPSLRLVIIGGEKALPDRWKAWQEYVGQRVRLVNNYGPTEATVGTTICELSATNPASTEVPIGRPIRNVQTNVLDRYLQPVPIGIPGELYIGGAGLARGYLNRPDLTAQNFIKNPLSDNPQSRLYKTGDKVRYLSDGNIEFLDRIDEQVKIRGFRIELGEIEVVLGQHPLVREAAVIAREDVPGDKRLVAYVVPQPDVTPISTLDHSDSGQIELWPSVGEFPVYDDLLYYAMTNDERRNHSYKVAINQLVKDKVVVEVGTGKDAILARFCVEAGARKVYAIEKSKEAYNLANTSLKNLGLSDKITLILGDATEVNLPEQADVCVSEIIGTIGSSEGVAVILNNARRFLKKDGVMIPQRSITKIAAISLPGELLHNPGFTEIPGYYVSQVFEQVGYPFDLRLCIKNFPKSNFISNSAIFEDLDFTVQTEPEYSFEVNLTLQKDSRLDGFLLWLQLSIIEGEFIDSIEHKCNWLPVYFPVFCPGIEVSEGDTIKAVCRGALSDNKVNPDYTIQGSVIKKTGEKVPFEYWSYHHFKGFKKTAFYELLFAQDGIKINQKNRPKQFTKQLKDYLKSQLSDYMVPSAFVILDTLPLTPNGKVDRHALPKPEFRPELRLSFVAPRTPVEEMLASIWAEVLGVQQVGIHDNFFELGGHSLLATSVISRIQEAFKIELQVHHLFEAPTIASLSQVIETARQAGFLEQSSSDKILDALPPLVPAVRDTHIPLSRVQEYIWYLQQLNPNSCLCNSGVPLRFNGSLSPEVVEKSINEIIRRHEILRTTFTIKEGQPVQVIAPSLTLPLKIVDLQDLPLAEREASVQRLVAEELQHHFDLANGPLIQATLLRLTPEEHWLLIPMHHIITDGWSISIFCQELETLISAFSVDLPNSKGTTALTPLPPVPFQYADFTLWERQNFNEEVLEKQLSYWLQKLADSSQPLNVLPSQPLCPSTHSRQASFYSLVLPKTLVASIEALSRSQGVTPFDIMITALNILLFKWSGQTEILVEATIGNRSIPESERILGCFINDVILRSLLWDSQTGLALLEQVKETVNEAINHKEVPLHKVIEAVRSKRELTISASVTMEPPLQGLDGMLKWKVLPVPPKCELWDEKIPIELYIYSPTEDSQTIEISGYCRTDLFPNQSLEPLFSDYQEILQKLVESPETKLSEF